MKRLLIIFAVILALLIGYSMFKKRNRAAPAASVPAVTLAEGTLTAGENHVLALDGSARLHGWGNVTDSSTGSQTSFQIPTRSTSTSSWKSIWAGSRATYAISDDGQLNRLAPQADGIRGMETPAADMSAKHEMALFPEWRWRKVREGWNVGAGIDFTGRLFFWLDDQIPGASHSSGEYGSPVQLGPGRKFVDVCSGDTRVFGVDEEGNLWRTGDLTNFKRERRGDTNVDDHEPLELRPIRVPVKLSKVYCARLHGRLFAIDSEGLLWAYGYNNFGEVGDGKGARNKRAEHVPENAIKRIGNQRWAMIALGHTHSLGIARDGSLWGWGRNLDSELGLGHEDSVDAPALIDKSRTWVALASTLHNGIALTRDGEIYAWGANGGTISVLGDGGVARKRSVPTRVLGNTKYGGP